MVQVQQGSSADCFNKRAFKLIACFLNVNWSFATHTCVHAPTLALFWQHSTICVLYKVKLFCFDHNSTTHMIAVTGWESSSHYTIQYLMQKSILVSTLLFHWKAFLVAKLLPFFCVLASCWHCKNETVAPSGASTAVTPGTMSLNLSRFSAKCFNSGRLFVLALRIPVVCPVCMWCT